MPFLIPLFASTLFTSAALLFLVQPMFGKMILPLLGGSASVWNACILFFQGILLTGYIYAHVTVTWIGTKRQIFLHLLVVLGTLVALPIGIPAGWSPPAQGNPVIWVLKLLFVSIGLPLFAVSTTSPVLQKWFAESGHSSAHDPYFLYQASNLGSLLGLLLYPVLLETTFPLSEQGRLWDVAYIFLIFLITCSAALVWRCNPRSGGSGGVPHADLDEAPLVSSDRHPVTAQRRVRWLALSFAPSSLMLGVTAYLSTDLAAVPLLWIIPLGLYLASLVVAFARNSVLPFEFLGRRLPFLVLASAITIFSRATHPIWILIPLHVLTFFIAALVCHRELAQDRPPTAFLTDFYLWISFGGVLGGLFNAFLAPVLFDDVLEYPLALALAFFLRRNVPNATKSSGAGYRWLDLILPLAIGLAMLVLNQTLKALPPVSGRIAHIMIFLPAALICLSFGDRPLRFALTLVALLIGTNAYTGSYGQVLYGERSYFGVHRIIADREQKFRWLFHGSTLHGGQSVDASRRLEPLAYYFRTGPIGQVFHVLGPRLAKDKIAVIGLGTGSLVCYSRPGQPWVFYEIDPIVERIARNARFFTYLRDCGSNTVVELGDARLSLAKAPDGSFGLIVVDAFSSDAIPVHLLTREAIALYFKKLGENGMLALHISNHHLNLRPVVNNLAVGANLEVLVRDDSRITAVEAAEGKLPSTWALLAGDRSAFGSLSRDSAWLSDKPVTAHRIWSDDFSNVLGVVRWW